MNFLPQESWNGRRTQDVLLSCPPPPVSTTATPTPDAAVPCMMYACENLANLFYHFPFPLASGCGSNLSFSVSSPHPLVPLFNT